MTSFGIDTAARLSSGLLSCGTRTEWVERCRASIGNREPLLDAADVLDLASTLWELPRCQQLLPELAAGLLLADQLSHSDLPILAVA